MSNFSWNPLSFRIQVFCCVLLLAATLSSSHLSAQTDSFWDTETGNWSESSNWSNGVPAGDYNAIINNGAGDIFQDMFGLDISGLSIESASANLILQHDTTVSQSFNWNGGTISGPGALNYNASTGDIRQGNLNTTFNNNGFLMLHAADGGITGNGAMSVFNGKSGSILNIDGDGSAFAGSGTVNIEAGGMMRKVTGFGQTTIDWDLNLNGFLDAFSGSMVFNGANNLVNGMISAGPGANVEFSAGTHTVFGPNASTTGTEGGVTLYGDATINNALNANSEFNLLGGTIDGSGTFDINGSFTWAEGTMMGDGVTNLNGGALLSDAHVYRTVNNQNGGGTLIAGTAIYGNENTIWNNRNEEIFKITGDQHLLGEGQFNNLDGAFFKKTGGEGTSVIEWDVFHEGNMILVEIEEMSLRGTSYINGQMMVLDGATLDFRGDATFGPDAYHADIGTFRISGGTATFDYAFESDQYTIIEGGAEINGEGTINMNNHLDWREDASMVGTGTTNIMATANIAASQLGRTINNYGQSDLNGVMSGLGGEWNNKSGSQLSLNSGSEFSGTGSLVNNAGGLIRRSANGSTSISFELFNDGRIEFDEDASIFFGGGIQQGQTGEFDLGTNGSAQIAEGSTFDGMIYGNGIFSGSAADVSGTISPGSSIGEIYFSDGLLLNEDARLLMEIGTEADLIRIGSVLELDGTVDILALDGFEAGLYTLIDYSEVFDFTDLGLELGSTPTGFRGFLIVDNVSQSVSVELTAIPEPASAVILAAALVGLVSRRRRTA